MYSVMNRRGLLVTCATTLAAPAVAQSGFPNRPIQLIVPWPPGGGTDGQLRSLAEIASRRFGQPIIIENRGGASGTLAAVTMAGTRRSDGYLIGQMPVTAFRLSLMSRRPAYDPLTDFTYIIQLTGYLFCVVVRPDSPWRTWQELLAHAKANPGKVTYSTSGVGTTNHLTMERIAALHGIEWLHVPFRGTAEAVQNVLGGTIDVSVTSASASLIEQGQLRLLVTWGEERSKRFPDVPNLRETGTDIVAASPYGLAAPKNLDAGIVRELHDVFKAALFDPSHTTALDLYDMPRMYLGTEDYVAAVRRSVAEEAAIIRRLGLQALD
jgi:tripartite-type tricarboxylate transporter receptor subunit TctC